jgi:hypothetical protein
MDIAEDSSRGTRAGRAALLRAVASFLLHDRVLLMRLAGRTVVSRADRHGMPSRSPRPYRSTGPARSSSPMDASISAPFAGRDGTSTRGTDGLSTCCAAHHREPPQSSERSSPPEHSLGAVRGCPVPGSLPRGPAGCGRLAERAIQGRTQVVHRDLVGRGGVDDHPRSSPDRTAWRGGPHIFAALDVVPVHP